MDQRTSLRTGRPKPVPAGLVGTAGLVGAAAAGSATAHMVAAATGPAGTMAWWMAAMGIACLACAMPLVRGRLGGRNVGHDGNAGSARNDAHRAAGHLVAMSAVMILIHLVLLVAPGVGNHHGRVDAAFTPSVHGATMLALIAIELLCLMGASAALRLARRPLLCMPYSAPPSSASHLTHTENRI
jgi:hypothetical protein